MKWIFFATGCAVAITLAGCSPGAGSVTPNASGASAVSFASNVKPILQRHCGDCHLDGKMKGGYSLETHITAIDAGQKGVRIVPGDSTRSNLVQRIRAAEGVKRMPPKGDLLSAAEVATIAAWIDQGASQE